MVCRLQLLGVPPTPRRRGRALLPSPCHQVQCRHPPTNHTTVYTRDEMLYLLLCTLTRIECLEWLALQLHEVLPVSLLEVEVQECGDVCTQSWKPGLNFDKRL